MFPGAGAFAVCVRPWLHPLGVQQKELEIEIEIDLGGVTGREI